MPTGDSIFSDTKKQFVYVVLSFIVSIVYLKKKWYEYWGLWMMALSFLLFCIFTFGSKTALMEGLIATFDSLFQGSEYQYFIIGILVIVPFVLILASLIILVDVSTAIVQKKHEGKITGKHKTDNAYRKMAYSLTGEIKDNGKTYSMEDFFKEYNGAKIYPQFEQSFDILISAFSFLILFVYTSQFAALLTQTVDTPGVKTVLSNSLITTTQITTRSTTVMNNITDWFSPPANAHAPPPAHAPRARPRRLGNLLKMLSSGIRMLLWFIFFLIVICLFFGGWTVVIAIFIAVSITLILPKIFKETFNFQFSKQGWSLITYLCSLILGSIGLAYSGEALKLKSRMRDS